MSWHPVHGPFLAVARRYSLCEDDALEAVSRAYLIAVRKSRRGEIRHETAVQWMKTVVKHEAMAVAEERRRDLSFDLARESGMDWPDERDGVAAVEDRLAGDGTDPRLPALRRAMRKLKPDERRALIMFHSLPPMQRHGGRYKAIARLNGWSYTKVNRVIVEGRRKLVEELVG